MTGDAVRQRLAEISARAEAAAEGEWVYDSYSHVFSTKMLATQDAWLRGQDDRHSFEYKTACEVCAAPSCGLAGEALARESAVCQVPTSRGDSAHGRQAADATFIAAARQDVPRLVAALTGTPERPGVLDLHKPVKRYQESPDSDYSYDSAELVADLWEVDVSSVTHFEVCAHCGPLEMATDDGGCYDSSLWPCDTYRAVATALEEQP